MKELKVTFIYLILLIMVTGLSQDFGGTPSIDRSLASTGTQATDDIQDDQTDEMNLALLFFQLSARLGISQDTLRRAARIDISESHQHSHAHNEVQIAEYQDDSRLGDDDVLTFPAYRRAGGRVRSEALSAEVQRPTLETTVSTRSAGQSQDSSKPLIGPMCECTGCRITSDFGPRPHIGSGFHYGRDIAAASGTPFYAACDGAVMQSDYAGNAGYRIEILCDDPQGMVVKGFHLMERSSLRPGDRIQQGQQIGKSGNTGRSTGAHMHMEFERNGERIPPETVLTEYGIDRNFFSQDCPDAVIEQNPDMNFQGQPSNLNQVIR